MQQQSFNKQFADRFREEWIYYPSFEEQEFEQLRFKQFAGANKEVPAIGHKLLERTSDASIIKGILMQVEQKAIPNTCTLSSVVQGMHETFRSYAANEPLYTGYIQELLINLPPFNSLIAFSQEKLECLLNKLEWLLMAEMNAHDREAFYEDLQNLNDDIGLCKNEIELYYRYFYLRFDEKTDCGHRIALTSQADLYLLQLVSYAEILIDSLEDLQILWEGWQLTRLILESQELYN